MAKRLKVSNPIDAVEDLFLTTEDVQKIFRCSESHVYMLSKTGKIAEIDISCNAKGGPNTKRYSVTSVNALIRDRKKQSLNTEI